jgi:hypothetical protein
MFKIGPGASSLDSSQPHGGGMGEGTTRDCKVQQVTTGGPVDSVSTLPACGCVTRRFVGSDAVPGAVVIGRWKSPQNPDATLSRGGSACIGTGQAWNVFNAALWSLRGIGPKSAHETFVGVGVMSSRWTGPVAASMMPAS